MYPESNPAPQQPPRLLPFSLSMSTLIAVAVLLVLLYLAVSARSLILGGASAVSLPAGPPLAGAVSQIMGFTGNNALLVPNKDYHLVSQYFDNNTWAITSVTPTSNNFDQGVAVLEKLHGTFQVVLGPGSAFEKSQLQTLPSDVAAYLQSHVAVYQLVPGSP